jgi:serine/threonine protein kinase
VGCSDDLSMPYIRKIDLALEVAIILESLHKVGVLHGDLKADNVMISHDGSLRLFDFGCSTCLKDSPRLEEYTYRFLPPHMVFCLIHTFRGVVYLCFCPSHGWIG